MSAKYTSMSIGLGLLGAVISPPLSVRADDNEAVVGYVAKLTATMLSDQKATIDCPDHSSCTGTLPDSTEFLVYPGEGGEYHAKLTHDTQDNLVFRASCGEGRRCNTIFSLTFTKAPKQLHLKDLDVLRARMLRTVGSLPGKVKTWRVSEGSTIIVDGEAEDGTPFQIEAKGDCRGSSCVHSMYLTYLSKPSK